MCHYHTASANDDGTKAHGQSETEQAHQHHVA
uniref:Uncharacterized protein n=1 Tax=Anopheles minimus TaxID=112268 RepID=A0A182WQ06_9DIPT